VQEVAFKKSLIFVTAMFTAYSLIFLYICLMVIFLNKNIESVGSPFFIAHGIYTFTVLTGYLTVILVYGAYANDIDNKIKDDLIKV
jgi:hypothetical protein